MARRKATDRAALLAMPHVHERDGAAYVRVYYQDGGRWRAKEKRVHTADEAADALAAIRRQLDADGASALDGARMTFAQLAREYLRAHPGKPRWYTDPPIEYFGDRPIRAITYADCLRFKEARAALPRRRQRPDAPEEPRALATVFRELEVLRAMLLYACRHGWIAKNPFSAGPPLITKTAEESRSRVPTPEEEARLLAVCIPPFRAHLRLIILAARDTGLRRSALQSLTWRMVDWEARLIFVPRATSRHKGRPPVVGLTRRLYDALREAWAGLAPQDPDARIFPVGDWKKSWTTACRLAGVEGLRFHDLRHGFATDLLEAGVNERLAMKMAGHSNPTVHAVYTNLDARQSLAVAAALDELHRRRGGV